MFCTGCREFDESFGLICRMAYYAHSIPGSGQEKWQVLGEHVFGVAAITARLAAKVATSRQLQLDQLPIRFAGSGRTLATQLRQPRFRQKAVNHFVGPFCIFRLSGWGKAGDHLIGRF
jgi:hypothetical protein